MGGGKLKESERKGKEGKGRERKRRRKKKGKELNKNKERKQSGEIKGRGQTSSRLVLSRPCIASNSQNSGIHPPYASIKIYLLWPACSHAAVHFVRKGETQCRSLQVQLEVGQLMQGYRLLG